MPRHPWSKLAATIPDTPERRLNYAEYRRASYVTQRLGRMLDFDDHTGVIDGSLEYDEDFYLASLRAYVEMLGGELQVEAIFPGQTIKLVPSPQD